MKQQKLLAKIVMVLLAVFFMVLPDNSLQAKVVDRQYAPGQLIVKLKAGKTIEDIQGLNIKYNIAESEQIFKQTSAPEDTLDRLKGKLAKLEQEHQSWYWQLDKDSQEYKDYLARVEKDKADLLRQIQAEEDLIAKLEQRQKRAPEGAAAPALDNIYLLNFPQDADIGRMVQDYGANENVEYAEPNYRVTLQVFPQTLPNDTYVDPLQKGNWTTGAWGQTFEDMWGLKKIQADKAWNLTQGTYLQDSADSKIKAGDPVIVAVIDSGIDYNHEDIVANVWINNAEISGNGIDDDGNGYIDDLRGWNFAYNNKDPLDDHGHGSHCAGIIAAIGNNAKGVIGVAPKAKVMALKGFDQEGSGSDNDFAQCLKYAVDNGADVLSNSWGRYGYSQVLKDTITYAYAKGCVIVAAAGNDNYDLRFFIPANYKEVITVSATDFQDQRAPFSSWGKIDVGAPGVSILSLRANGTDMYNNGYFVVGGKYFRCDGTSMSCPHVAAVAALVLSLHPEFTNNQVRQCLRVSAEDIITPGWDEGSGYGRINSAKAVQINSVLDVAISSPGYYETIGSDTLSIQGTASGDGFKYYKLEYGLGSAVASWTTIKDKTYTPVSKGELGVLLAGNLPEGNITLRLSAEDDQGLIYTDRVMFLRAKNMMPGFPKVLENCLREPTIGDINGDGKKEIVVISQQAPAFAAWIHVFDLSGQELKGFPVPIDSFGYSAAALADLDKDGDLEIIVGGHNEISPTVSCGKLYAYHHLDRDNDGSADLVKGFPVLGAIGNSNSTFLGSAVLCDINKDGYLEIIIGDFGGRLYLIDHAGRILASFDAGVDNVIRSSASVADVNNDGDYEIAFRTDKTTVFLLDSSLQVIWQYPLDPSIDFSSLVLADLDNNGQMEIIMAHSVRDEVYVFKADGTRWPYIFRLNRYPGVCIEDHYVAVADLDSDGDLEIITNGALYNHLYAWHHNGTFVQGWPTAQENNWFQGPVTVADIDGDTQPEVLAGNYNYQMYAYKANGTLVPGWPKSTVFSQTSIAVPTNGVVIDDLENDGKIELIVTVGDARSTGGVGVWSLGVKASPYIWPSFLHDNYHTGNFYAYRIPPFTADTGIDVDWHQAVTVTLNAADAAGSGIDKTYYAYSASGSALVTNVYTGPFTLSSEGEYIIKYYSVDKFGNKEAVKAALNTAKIDRTAPTGSIRINGGDLFTRSLKVSLRLQSFDALSGGIQMQFSNDKVTWSTLENYSVTKQWMLASGIANKTVYVKFRDAAGNWSGVYSDTIYLIDPTPPTRPDVYYALGQRQGNNVIINARWRSNDPESGILKYRYRVLAGKTAAVVARKWAATTATTRQIILPASLRREKIYYVEVQARNNAGLWSSIGRSKQIEVK